MKRFVCAFLSLVLMLSMIACGKPDVKDTIDPDDLDIGNSEVTIEFIGWGDAKEILNYQTLVNQFMDEYPNITVVYRGEGSASYMNTLKNRANNLPDLFYMPDTDFLEWVSNGKLMDITSAISEEELSDLWPHAVDEYYYNPNTTMLGKGEGAKLYGLPKDLGPFTLVYNKTKLDQLITQNGLNRDEVYELLSPTDPMTWQEFRDLLKQLDTNPNDSLYGISHYELEAALYSNNTNFFNEDASESWITTPEFTEALQFIADLHLVDGVMPSADDQVSTNGYQRFLAQGCVFSFMGPWDCAQFWESAAFEFDVCPVPYNGENPEASSTAWVGSMGYCVGVHSTGPGEAAAAVLLAKYLCYNEAAQRKFYELGQQVPNIVDMANDEYINDTHDIIGNKGPANRSVFVDTINGTSETDVVGGKTRSRYYTYLSDWYDMFTEYVNARGLWDGTRTAATICSEYEEDFQFFLDDMQLNLGR